MHPEQWPRGVAAGRTPPCITSPDPSAGAQCAEQLRLAVGRECREHTRELSRRVVAESEYGVHGAAVAIRELLRLSGGAGERGVENLSQVGRHLHAFEQLIADEKRWRRAHTGLGGFVVIGLDDRQHLVR